MLLGTNSCPPSLRLVTSPRRFAHALIPLFALVVASCSDKSTPAPPPPPVLTTLNVTVATPTITIGQTSNATAAGLDQNGAAIEPGTLTWSSASQTVATVTAAGVVTGVTAGTTQIIATSANGKTGQQSITVTAPPGIKINEVESNGGTPGDWVELYNPTAAAVDVSGWMFRDNDTTHAFYRIPAGTSIPAGGYYLVEEAQFGFGLGAPDEARLHNQFGAPVDVYSWTAHASTTYARCPNGSGAFVTSTASTKGAVNDCRPLVKIKEVELTPVECSTHIFVGLIGRTKLDCVRT